MTPAGSRWKIQTKFASPKSPIPRTGTSSITWERRSRTYNAGTRLHGDIDVARRRDHMQQHSAQHVLSAAFVQLFNMRTISFHMADDYCSIDLDTPSLAQEQVEAAERLANEILCLNRPVDIRFVNRDEAANLGLRKLPPAEREELRLIDIHDFDLSACGGTHVNHTGQIAGLLLRKTEKVRQGYRVEFVAGLRAVEPLAAISQPSPKPPRFSLLTSTLSLRTPANLSTRSSLCANSASNCSTISPRHKRQLC